MFGDLHLHTHFSDGTFSPEELALRAERAGLQVIALTDHDTIEGCERARVACEARGIHFVYGAELTAEEEGVEEHLLGYNLNPNHPGLSEATQRLHKARVDRIYEMVRRINELGLELDPALVFEIARCRAPGRPHVARAMVKSGLCATLEEAFENYLKKGKPAWAPKFRISVEEGIALIHGAGGMASLAHPALSRRDDFLARFKEMGLDGVECYHSKHTGSDAKRYVRMARELDLIVTGGSDCHGYSRKTPLIGSVKLHEDHLRKFLEYVDTSSRAQ